MIRKKCEIINKLGLHARAAAKFVQTASKFQSDIEIIHKDNHANGKSIMGIMMLAASQHAWLEVQVNGPDEEAAISAISALIANRFGEEK